MPGIATAVHDALVKIFPQLKAEGQTFACAEANRNPLQDPGSLRESLSPMMYRVMRADGPGPDAGGPAGHLGC